MGYTNPVDILAVYVPGLTGVFIVWRHYGSKGRGAAAVVIVAINRKAMLDRRCAVTTILMPANEDLAPATAGRPSEESQTRQQECPVPCR